MGWDFTPVTWYQLEPSKQMHRALLCGGTPHFALDQTLFLTDDTGINVLGESPFSSVCASSVVRKLFLHKGAMRMQLPNVAILGYKL